MHDSGAVSLVSCLPTIARPVIDSWVTCRMMGLVFFIVDCCSTSHSLGFLVKVFQRHDVFQTTIL
jgi:hypothetical protein